MRNVQRNRERRVRNGLLGVAIAAGLAVSSSSPAGVTVSIQPEVTVVPVDTEFEVSIRVAGIDTISNFQAFVRFDPELLEFVDAIEGSLYVYTGDWDNTWFFFEEESLGTWEVFDVIFPAMSYVLPPGELARIRFRSLADGLSPIEPGDPSVKDIHRLPVLPLDVRPGYACIGNVTGTEGYGPVRGPWDLGAPHPNPTVTGTSVLLAAPGGAREVPGRVAVYDCSGALVRELAWRLRAGTEIGWDGKDLRGNRVPPGVYFLRLEVPDRAVARRVLVLR
jgi:hypothetical protein